MVCTAILLTRHRESVKSDCLLVPLGARYTIAPPPNRPGGNVSLVWIPGQRYISFGMARWSLYQLDYLIFWYDVIIMLYSFVDVLHVTRDCCWHSWQAPCWFCGWGYVSTMAVCCWWCISRVGMCCTNQQFYFTVFHWGVSTIVEWPWNGLYRNSVNTPLGVCEVVLFVGTMGCPLYYYITTESPWWKRILSVNSWAKIYLLLYGQVEFVSVGLFNFFVWCTHDAVFFCECITCHPRLRTGISWAAIHTCNTVFYRQIEDTLN